MNLSKAFTRRERVLLVIMSIVLLCGAYFFLVHQPVEAQKADLIVAAAEAENERILLDAKVTKIAEMEAELAELPKGAAPTPDYDNLQPVVNHLNAVMASTLDYTMSFQPVVLPEEGHIVRRAIDMTFTCSDYAAAHDIISQLHYGPFRCQLDNLSVSAERTDGTSTDYTPALPVSQTEVSLTITYFENK
ncbi:MAG: hypothetical protein RR450_03500 [Oscillospiraceae bacterium]